nr:hypothetical protein [Tanacetum cinerariifolium]
PVWRCDITAVVVCGSTEGLARCEMMKTNNELCSLEKGRFGAFIDVREETGSMKKVNKIMAHYRYSRWRLCNALKSKREENDASLSESETIAEAYYDGQA